MNIALIGYGKMGKTIERLATERGHTISLKIDSTNLSEFTKENLLNTKTDVAIEFTRPDVAYANIHKLLGVGVGVVSGTTGWLDQWDDIVNYMLETKGSLIYASNYSVGVNIFFEINRQLAKMMENQPAYDVSVEEIHHTAKKDAPSGTGITIAEDIIHNIKRKTDWVNSNTDVSDQLSILSKREDPAPGTHSVKYTSDIDDIEIIHTAKSREGFALGAIYAAEFLKDKSGLYTMKNVLGL